MILRFVLSLCLLSSGKLKFSLFHAIEEDNAIEITKTQIKPFKFDVLMLTKIVSSHILCIFL